jgi:hypothetical protein
MSKTTENTDKLLKFIADKFEAGELDNNSLVQIIELSASYLNLKTISQYAKDHNISYNGAKNFRQVITILNQKLIIDNK